MCKRFFLFLAVICSFFISPVSANPLPKSLTGKRILVAYFTRSENTKKLATYIHDITGGTLHQITTKIPYPEDYLEVLAQATTEQHVNARPALAEEVNGIRHYDIIFLGFPIWWGDTPMAIKTFLESYDLSGKTIIAFTTYGSSGFSNSMQSIKMLAPQSTVIQGFGCAGNTIDTQAENVKEWLENLEL